MAAASASRAAVLTVSPMTVYSSAACTPATTSPVFRPTRSPSGAPPPRSSSSTRRTARCIDSAARTARSASSSCATGAPNTAMIPSPVSLSTCPPKVLTAPARAAMTRSVTAPTRSGSRSSAQAVKSDRSPKSTVTTRRSVAGSSAAAGSAAPQWWQNRAPGTATVPHTGQVIGLSRCVPTHTRAGRFQVRQLGRDGGLRGGPHRPVDVGVDDLHDLPRGAGAGGQRLPDLGQPGPAVLQVGARRRAAVGESRTMTREYRYRTEPGQPLQAVQVVPEVAVDDRGAPAADGVAGEHDPFAAELGPETHRVGGVPRRGEQRDVQPVERAARLTRGPDRGGTGHPEQRFETVDVVGVPVGEQDQARPVGGERGQVPFVGGAGVDHDGPPAGRRQYPRVGAVERHRPQARSTDSREPVRPPPRPPPYRRAD